MTYLLDKSSWVISGRNPEVAERLARYTRSGSPGVCTLTALEVLYSARNAEEHRRATCG